MDDDHHLMLEHSVIRIIGKDGKTTCGTGFLVAENTAVTCAHVVGVAGAKPGSLIQIKFDGSDDLQWANVDEQHFSPGDVDDVAFILLNDKPNHARPLPLASAVHSDGHPYRCYGYPSFSDPANSHKVIGTINGVVTAKEKPVRPYLVMVAEDWGHGLSGAPIYDLKLGAVVGMVTKGLGIQKTQLGYATTADTIHFHNPAISINEQPIPGLPPQGILPNPAPLPPGSRMTHPRNNLFTGREEDLHVLAAELLYSADGKTVALTQPVAAAGMGGIGKTQLAAEFCYRYGQFCEGVHWINAANADAIGAEIADCGLKMGLQPWSDKQPEQIEATLWEWAKSKRRLIVFDNLEKPEALAEWLPKLQYVHMLATTRRVEWPPELGLRVQRLERFPRSESLRLLRKLCSRLEQEPDEILGQLAEVLCDLPLAIDLAGRYLNERKSLSPNQYIEDLKSSGVLSDYAMSDEGANAATHHLKSLEATFELSWKELDAPEGKRRSREMHLARLTFCCAGYCAPAVAIPTGLLQRAVKKALGTGGEDGNFNPAFERGLVHLCALGFLEAAEGSVTTHPLLAEFARKKDESSLEHKRNLPSLSRTLATVSYLVVGNEIPAAFLPLRPHLEVTAFYAEQNGLEIAVPLWNNLGYHLNLVGNFSRSRQLHEHVLEYAEKIYGSENHIVAICNSSLGLVLRAVGDYLGAKAHFLQALKIGEKVLGSEHPDVATWTNNLGLVLHDLGDLEAAKEYHERALKLDEQAYGREHSKVATDANNLGSVLKDMGNLTEAKLHYERALIIHERVHGKENPSVATDLNNLGLVFQELGDLEGAMNCFEQALNIDERAYGKEHPAVARSINNMGGLLLALGDLEEAKKCFERALAILVKFLPEGHKYIRWSRENLATVAEKLQARGETNKNDEGPIA